MRKNSVSKLSLRVFYLLAGWVLSSSASASSYTFTTLSPLSGGYRSDAVAINNLGQVVGTSELYCDACTPSTSTRATFWGGGTATQVPLPGGENTYATDINDSGYVVGWTSTTYTVHNDAFLWNSGTAGAATYLNTIYYDNSASSINNLGQVAGGGSNPNSSGSAVVWNGPAGTIYLGNSSDAKDINDLGQLAGNMNGQPTLWNGTTATTLGTLDGGYGVTEAINNSGQVAGWSLTNAGFYHATLWNSATPLDLGSLGGNSYAFGINGAGQVVGQSYLSIGGPHAFLWDGAGMTDLNRMLDAGSVGAGWVLIGAQDINDHGQIVGTAHNTITGQTQAFLLSPVPEPGAYAMMLAGLVLVAAGVRRRSEEPA